MNEKLNATEDQEEKILNLSTWQSVVLRMFYEI